MSDQITRKGLERIREYCKNSNCQVCKIKHHCIAFSVCLCNSELRHINVFPHQWSNDNITEILKATRNYMEATFIKTLEQIVKLEGECCAIECQECPFAGAYQEHCYHCNHNQLRHKGSYTEKLELAEMLLEYYKGEME